MPYESLLEYRDDRLHTFEVDAPGQGHEESRGQGSADKPGGGGSTGPSVVPSTLTLAELVERLCTPQYAPTIVDSPNLCDRDHKLLFRVPVNGTASLTPPDAPPGDSEDSMPASSPQEKYQWVDYDHMDAVVHRVIRRQLELETCTPLMYKHIRGYFLQVHAEQERLYARNIHLLLQKPQSYFGIAERFLSPSQWYDVKKAFRHIKSHELPMDRMHAYVEAIRMITVICHLEHLPNPLPAGVGVGAGDREGHGHGEAIIGADDFFPILLYVVIHCKIVNMLALNAEFQALCGHYWKISEFGYYITTLDAAVSHILEFKPEEEGREVL